MFMLPEAEDNTPSARFSPGQQVRRHLRILRLLSRRVGGERDDNIYIVTMPRTYQCAGEGAAEGEGEGAVSAGTEVAGSAGLAGLVGFVASGASHSENALA